MTVIPALLLCSLLLVAASIVLFVWSSRQGDCHQAERLCLLPLDDDASPPPSPRPAPSTPSTEGKP